MIYNSAKSDFCISVSKISSNRFQPVGVSQFAEIYNW